MDAQSYKALEGRVVNLLYQIRGVLHAPLQPASPAVVLPVLNGLHLVPWQLALLLNSTIMTELFLIFLLCPISGRLIT